MTANQRSTPFVVGLTLVAFGLSRPPVLSAATPVEDGEMAGYLLIPNEKVPPNFNGGFSMYVAAWPLLERYPVWWPRRLEAGACTVCDREGEVRRSR